LRVLSKSHQQRIRGLFDALGIDQQRLNFVGSFARVEYLSQYHNIDIALDTLPYNGITTTCDALWMGVPVVTMIGPTAAGRAGFGILSNVGLPELVARTPDEFVDITTNLARDVSKRAALRKTLRQQMEQSPLMDGPRFARNMETAYRQMWHQTWGTPSN
jgi:predicted O-linked N-acetylglucosamine transferase (SPINDLY family)